MKKPVALVARADNTRVKIAKALRDNNYDVFECEELAISTSFVGVVVVDDRDDGDALRTRVLTWIRAASSPRVVVVSAKPTAWKTLSISYNERLAVLAAPSFSWEIVDALRSSPPSLLPLA